MSLTFLLCEGVFDKLMSACQPWQKTRLKTHPLNARSSLQ